MSWQPTAAVARVTVLPAALALVAVLTRHPDLLVLAAPLALAAVPLVRRPPGTPRVTVDLSEESVPEGADLQLTVQVTDAAGARTAALAVATPDSVRPRSRGLVSTTVRPDRTGRTGVTVDLVARRWGWSQVGPATVVLSACAGLLRADLPVPARRVRVLPLSSRYRGSEGLPRARGTVGLHRSRLPGEGSELAGVRPFAPGDRMRRIHWRTSIGPGGLRADRLQVHATTTERDADVVVLLDARFDAGARGPAGDRGPDAPATGLDLAVRATAALAACYLELGDRVGLVTWTAGARLLPARAGRAQLERVLSALLETATPRAGGAEPPLVAPAGLDPRALVLLVSPLVGREVFGQAAALGRAGHPVVVVDTLPADARPADALADGPGPWTTSVARLWLLERATRTAQLQSLGVPVVPWRGSGSLDAVLQQLARAAARPGARR